MEIGKNMATNTNRQCLWRVTHKVHNICWRLVGIHAPNVPSDRDDRGNIILDMGELKFRYLQGRDTQLIRDIQAPDFDGVKHMTECGLEMTQAKVHHRIKGWNKVT